MVALILDGHESYASYRRHCTGCLQRRIQTTEDGRIQYYHRRVTAVLRVWRFTFLLDAEPVRPGEGEVAAALRLLERRLAFVPRSFDGIPVNGLCAQTEFFARTLEAGKHVVAVLKDERRELLEGARGLFFQISPQHERGDRRHRLLWHQEGFLSRSTPKRPVRVVRSLETSKVERQDGSGCERLESEWFWVPTLASSRASPGRSWIWGTNDGPSRTRASTSWSTTGTQIMFSA